MPRSSKHSPSVVSSRAAPQEGAGEEDPDVRSVVDSHRDALTDVRCAAYATGRVWTATKGGQIVVRDPRCKVLAMLDETERCGHPACITVVGSFVWIGYSTGIIKVYSTSTVREAPGGEFKRHSGAVHDITSMMHGSSTRVFSASSDFLILMWSRDFQMLRQMSGHGAGVRSLCAKGRVLLSASDDGTFRAWDVASGDALQRIHAHQSGVRAVLYHLEMIWTAGEDGLVQVWEGSTFAPLATLEAHSGPVSCLLAVDWEVWSGGADHSICAWSARDFTLLRRLANHENFVTSLVKVVAQREHSEVWSAGADKTINVWGFQQLFDTEECQRLREDLAMAQEAYKQQHAEMLKKYARLEHKKDERISQLNQKIADQVDDLMMVEHVHTDLKRILAEKEGDIAKACADEFEAERASLQEEVAALTQREADARSEVAHHAARAASIPHLESSLEVETQRNATFQLQLNDLQNELNAATLSLATRTAELDGARRAADTEIDELKTRLSTRDERVSFLTNEVERGVIRSADLDEQTRHLQAKLDAAHESIERLEEDTEHMKHRLEGQDAMLRQGEALHVNVGTLEQLLATAEEERDDAITEAQALRAAITTNEKDFNAHVAAVRDATESSPPEALQEELTHIKELLATATADKEAAETRIDELEDQLDEEQNKAGSHETDSGGGSGGVSPTHSARRPPLPPSPGGSAASRQRLQGMEDRVFDLEQEREVLHHQLEQIRLVLPEGRPDVVESARRLAEEVADLRAAAIDARQAMDSHNILTLRHKDTTVDEPERDDSNLAVRLDEAERALTDAHKAQAASTACLDRLREMVGAEDNDDLLTEVQTLRAAASTVGASTSSRHPTSPLGARNTGEHPALESLTDTSSPHSTLSAEISAADGNEEEADPVLSPISVDHHHDNELQLLQDLCDHALGTHGCNVLAAVRGLLGEVASVKEVLDVGEEGWVAAVAVAVRGRDEAVSHLGKVQTLLEEDAVELRAWKDEISAAASQPEAALRTLLEDYREAVTFIASLYDAARTRRSSNIISLLNEKVDHFQQERLRSVSPTPSVSDHPTRQSITRTSDYVEASLGSASPEIRREIHEIEEEEDPIREGLKGELSRVKDALLDELKEKDFLIETLRNEVSLLTANPTTTMELETTCKTLRVSLATEQRAREALQDRLIEAEEVASEAERLRTEATQTTRELRRELRREATKTADLQGEIEASRIDAQDGADRRAELAEKRVRLERAELRATEAETRIAEAESRCVDLEAQVGALHAADASGSLRDLRRDLRKASADALDLEARLRDAEDERDALQAASSKHATSLADLRSRLHESQAALRLKENDDELHALRLDLRKLTTELATARQRLLTTEEERDESKTRTALLEEKVADAKTHDSTVTREARKEARRALTEAAESRQRCEDAQADLIAASKQEELVRKAKEDIIGSLKARVYEAERAALASEAQAKAAKAESEARLTSIAELKSRLEELETQSDTSRQLESAELRELKSELRKEITHHAEARRKADIATARQEELRAQLADKSAHSVILTEGISRLETTNATLQAKLARLPTVEEEAQRLRARLDTSEAAADASRLSDNADMRDTKKDNRRLTAELSDALQKLEDAEHFIGELETMLEGGKGRASKHEAKDLQRRLEALSEELGQARAKAATADTLHTTIAQMERQQRLTAEELAEAKVLSLHTANITIERDELQAQVSGLRQERDGEGREAKKEARKVKAQLLEMTSQLSGVEGELAERVAAGVAEQQESRRRVDELLTELASSAEAVSTWKLKHDTLETRCQHKGHELAAALEEVALLDAELQRVVDEGDAVREQLKEQTEKVRNGQLETAKWKLENTARDEVQATLDAAEHRIQLLETDAKHADETHRAACAAAQSRADTAEAELAARNVAGEGHAAQQQKARNEVSALRLQLVELRAEVEDLNNACACERDRAERLARKGAADVAALKAELEAAEQRCSVKVGALQQAEAEQRKLAAEVNALRATLKETASYEAQHQNDMDLTRTSMADAEVKYLNLEKQLQRTTQELRAQLEEEQDAFHQERTRIEADTTAVHSEHEAAVLEVRQLQEQLRNATDEIDDLKQLLDGASVRKPDSADSGAPSPFATNLDDTARRRGSGGDAPSSPPTSQDALKYLAAELAAAEKKVEELQEAAIIAAERGDGSRGDEDGGGRAAWEAERREMDAEVARLHEHIEGSNAACEEKHAEVMSLQERLDTMTITNGQLTQDVEQLKEAVSADGGGVSTRPATPSEAEKADELAAQNTVLMRGLREAEADAERARGKAAELERQVADLKEAEEKQLESSFVGYDEEVRDWQRRCRDLEDRLAQAREAVVAAEQSAAQQAEAAEDYKQIAKEMTQKGDELEEEVAGLQAALGSAQEIQAEQAATLAQQAEKTTPPSEQDATPSDTPTVAQLTQQVVFLKEQNSALRKTIADFKSRNMFLALDKNELVDQFTEAESKATTLRKQAEALQATLAEERKVNEQKDSEIEQYKTEILHLSKGYTPAKENQNQSFQTPPSQPAAYDDSPAYESQELLLENTRQELHNMTEEYREQLRINSALRLQIEDMSEGLRGQRMSDAHAEAVDAVRGTPQSGAWRGAGNTNTIQHSGVSPSRSATQRHIPSPQNTSHSTMQDTSLYQTQLDNLEEVAQFLQLRTLGVEADAAVVEALNDQTSRVKRDFEKVDAMLQSEDGDRALLEGLRTMFDRDTGVLHEKNSQLQSSILKLQQAYKHILGILHTGQHAASRRPQPQQSNTSKDAEVENVALRCVVQLVAGQLKLRDDKLRRLREKHARVVADVRHSSGSGNTVSSGGARKIAVHDVVSDLTEVFARVQALAQHVEQDLPSLVLPDMDLLEEHASALVLKYSNLLSESRSVSAATGGGSGAGGGRVSPLPPDNNNRMPANAPPSLAGLLPYRAL